MKKFAVVFAIISLLYVTYLTAQMPVILSQPTSVSACEGDSLSIEVIAEGKSKLQWFTAQKNGLGYYNYQEIPGENLYRLTLNPAKASEKYYLLRLVFNSDTLWSAGINVFIYLPREPIGDTIQVNHLPGHIRLFGGVLVAYQRLIWSKGDTTDYPSGNDIITFNTYGKHWVKTIQAGCSRTDTFIVAECPHTIHIDSVNTTPECLCADTVYIDRDVNGGVTSVASGTTIKFTGDYRFSSGYMDSRAVGNDSIVFEGYFNPVTQKWQGRLNSYHQSPYDREPTRFESTIIKHLELITLHSPGGSVSFYHNEHISNHGASKSVFYQNRLIEITGSANGCTFFENDTVLGIPSTDGSKQGTISRFNFSNNSFVSNKSGLIIRYPNLNGPVHITKCIFNHNPSTSVNIQSKSFADYIDQNIFIQNTPNPGAPVISSRNHTVFRNNTLINNSGACDLLLTNPDSSGIRGEVLNNIFWSSSGNRTKLKVQGSTSELTINHNSFGYDSTKVVVPFDTNVTFANNLFSIYPQFVDTLYDNYMLRETSSLIDKGTDIEHGPELSDYYYTKDITGFPRKNGLAIDLGAYEYHATSPLAFQYITPDTIVCSKDTFTLKAIPERGFDDNNMICTWYRNGSKWSDENLPYLVIKGVPTYYNAVYEAVITNQLDTLRSGPIHLSVIPKPDLAQQFKYQLACNETDLLIKVTKPQLHTNYWWSSAKRGTFAQPTSELVLPHVVESDTLTITAVNACSSAQSAPIILKIAPLPAPSLGPDTTLHAGDSLLLDAGEGVLYAWSSGDTSPQVYGYPNDTAWVTVTNAYGCTGSDTVAISMIPSRLDEPKAQPIQLLLYPNPAHDRLFISIPEDADLPCRLQLISANGTVVRDIVLSSVGIHDTELTSLEKGTYTVILLSETTRGNGKLVVW